jgi:hypothetical protein
MFKLMGLRAGTGGRKRVLAPTDMTMTPSSMATFPPPFPRGKRFISLGLTPFLVCLVVLIGPVDRALAGSPPMSEATNSVAEEPNHLINTNGYPMDFHGGYVQHRPHVFVTFWGSEWNSYAAAREDVLNLYRTISGSSYANILTQYFDYNGPISNETDLTSYTDTRQSYPAHVSMDDLKNEVHYSIQHDSYWKASWEAPNRYENQYVIITPPNTSNTPLSEACGLHAWNAESWQVSWTDIAWPPSGCLRGLSASHALQVIASHEWAESATDPIPNNPYIEGGHPGLTGWAYGDGGEIGDLCQTLSSAEHTEIASGVFAAHLFDDYLYAANGTPCVAHDSTSERFSLSTGQGTVFAPRKATLRGNLDPAGWLAGYRFELTGPDGTVFLPNRSGQGSIWTAFPQSLENVGGSLFGNRELTAVAEGLKPETTYQVRLKGATRLAVSALVNLGESSLFSGGETQFTTPDWRPQISNVYESDVKPVENVGRANLHAEINPEGSDTHYRFEWGKSPSSGGSGVSEHSIPVPDGDIGSGSSNVPVSQSVGALKGLTTYEYRVYASNVEGSHTSSVHSFTTPDWRPQVTIESASEVRVVAEKGRATLRGKVNPRGFATKYHYEWGTEAEFKEGKYGHLIPVPDKEITGESNLTANYTIEGIKGLTTYHYRLVAENAEGKTTSSDQSFTTPDWRPGVVLDDASDVVTRNASFSATVESRGFVTHYDFEWGTTAEHENGEYNHHSQELGVFAGNPPDEFEETLNGLFGSETYYYRLVAENAEGSTTVSKSFSTPDWSPGIAEWFKADVTGDRATLRAGIAPNGFYTHYFFEWGTSTEYGNQIPVPERDIGSGKTGATVVIPVSQTLYSLEKGTYHWRLVAVSAEGENAGEDQTFNVPAQGFVAEQPEYSKGYPVTYKAVQWNSLRFDALGIEVSCELPDMKAEGSEEVGNLAMGGEGNCYFPGGWNPPLELNGCQFEFSPGHPGEWESHPEFSIGPPGCGPVKIPSNYGCSFDLEPGTGYELSLYNEEEEKPSATVFANARAANLKYQFCGNPHEGGELTGDWKIHAENSINVPVNVTTAQITTHQNEPQATHAPQLEAETYPASLKGAGLNSFTTEAGTFECASPVIQSTLSAPVTEFSLGASYGECNATIGGTNFKASLTMNGCHYQLRARNAGPPFYGAWGVACSSESELIELKVWAVGKYRKCVNIFPQQDPDWISLQNSEAGMKRNVSTQAHITGIKYEQVGLCGSNEVFYEGSLGGLTNLHGTNESKSPVGVYIGGQEQPLAAYIESGESSQPQFEAGTYPTTFTGKGLPTFTSGIGTFKCTDPTLEAPIEEPTTQLSLKAEYGKCSATIGEAHYEALVEMNSCYYTLGLRPEGGPPSIGGWTIACDKEGDGVEFKIYALGKYRRCMKLTPQQSPEYIEVTVDGTWAERTIGIEAEVTHLSYAVEGSCGSEVREDGVLKGSGSLEGAG